MTYHSALIAIINDVLAHGLAHHTSTNPTNTSGLGANGRDYALATDAKDNRSVSKQRKRS